MKQQPPKLARRFFDWYCGQAKVEDLVGDLDEWFYQNLKTKSPAKAKIIYWRQTLLLIFSYAIKRRKQKAAPSSYSSTSFSLDMLRNYIKVAIRNLYQYRYFSILNVLGLAVGMSVSLLFISLISYVSTYDSFQVNKDNIYTIVTSRTEGFEAAEYATAPIVLADKLRESFPDAREVVRIHSGFNEEVIMDNGILPLQGYYAEPNFLNVFTYIITAGNGESALSKPNTIIITESAAIKFFNTTDVVGKMLELDQGGLLEIGAVMKDHPVNSHLKFEILISYSTLPESQLSLTDQWTNYRNQYVYVLLSETTKQSILQKYLDHIKTPIDNRSPIKVSFNSQSLDDITMGPDYRNAIGPKWEASGMIVFAIISILILLPACFNYTNISIARALKRSKEIGLRKTMGCVNSQIFFQFITETVVIAMVSLLGALLLFVLIRSEFQSMMVASASIDLSLTWRTVVLFMLFALGTGLVAGIFPALYFSRLNPILALKNKINARGTSGMRVRKVLTVFQFALSFGFILSLIVFNRQYQYSLNFDFGFQKKNIIDVPLQDVDALVFKGEFSKLAEVQSISFSSGLMGLGSPTTWIHSGESDSTEVSQQFIDTQYISNFGFQFLAGQNFSGESQQRERHIIVNEEFIKHYNLQNPIDAIGQTFNIDGQELEVIGVLKNFHFAPLRYPIKEFIFRTNPSAYQYANLHVTTSDVFGLFTNMETTWKSLSTIKKFEGKFFEDEINESYLTYQVLLKIVGFLGLLAITISLLGMLGMVVYTSETKTKEVSIRKVMGANVYNLALLLTKDYLKLLVWAILISAPITVFILSKMLPQLQYYSVNISAWDVAISTIVLLALGILTIASQIYKTAMTNPADTLKGE